MYAAVIPPKVACFNSLNVIRGPKDDRSRHYVVAVLNSFVYEYLIRKQSKNNNVNIYFVSLTPLPILRATDPRFGRIASMSADLHRLNSQTNGAPGDLEAKLEAAVAHVYGLTDDEFEFILEGFHRVPEQYRQLVLQIFREKEGWLAA